jgi:hypothetical protein
MSICFTPRAFIAANIISAFALVYVLSTGAAKARFFALFFAFAFIFSFFTLEEEEGATAVGSAAAS